jgi:hypothetical protein
MSASKNKRKLSPWAGYVGPAMVWPSLLAAGIRMSPRFYKGCMGGMDFMIIAALIAVMGTLFCGVFLLTVLGGRTTFFSRGNGPAGRYLRTRKAHRQFALGGVALSALSLIFVAIYLCVMMAR